MSLEIKKRKRTKTRDELLSVLSQFSDIQALQLLWALNVLQLDCPTELRPDLRPYLRYPPPAAKARLGDKAFALKWEIENLLLLMLSNPKTRENIIPDRFFEFDTACILLNLYKKAEEAENKILITEQNIISEMQRYAHKQFLWQREFFQPERIYRYYYVYGQGNCATYFEQKYGLTMEEFALSCIGLYMKMLQSAWEPVPGLGGVKELRTEVIDLTMNIISKELVDLRTDTAKRIYEVADKYSSKLSYLPSSLRHYPIITSKKNGNRIIAPLPQLIMLRATSGLYYDFADGPQTLIEEANSRFEQYAKELIEARCPRFSVSREKTFGPKKARMKTPDLLLMENDQIKVVFECKATKLTFAAQFADNQYAEAPTAFNQIAKGMSQLWKFFSRARRGIYAEETVSPDVYGVILTMDNWFNLTGTQLPELRKKAAQLAADEPGIAPEDMREVVFCSIEELDDVLAVSTEDEFLETLRKSQLPEHHGWQLPVVRNPGWALNLERKAYPFNVADVLPLWNVIGR
ncbi:hypothetical protein EOB36_03725 [Mesorhizobium sp. M6A.T.Cr.TU.017.01.1.1]|uniref:hypothetical protein n=1 Tax=Mesorhizobium sp. M6A.T.Cr.TU.017.01.1.1 TaxID=2496774 RepID=UPI000FD1BAF9|nr:hypothetical protein [Mesorhizobium sp. M6A.T.Cr.TU.017.01.1.1]RUV04149.1 hypothetical protein EOB36_03725 [Mesorhizobium sp. M6A.T.Cr.TU.017.01.1.1]